MNPAHPCYLRIIPPCLVQQQGTQEAIRRLFLAHGTAEAVATNALSGNSGDSGMARNQ